MPVITETSSREFAPHPEYTGVAVIVDITEPKLVSGYQGKQEMKFRIVLETTEIQTDDGPLQGHPFCVWSMPFTLSIHEKSSLRKFLKGMFGRDLTKEELAGFDTESLIGRNVNLVVVHVVEGDKVYANFASCTPWKGAPHPASGKFVRAKDRNKDVNRNSPPASVAGTPSAEIVDHLKVKVHIGKKSRGVEFRELSPESIQLLIQHWVPQTKDQPSLSADDKRLLAAVDWWTKEQANKAEPSDGNDEIPY